MSASGTAPGPAGGGPDSLAHARKVVIGLMPVNFLYAIDQSMVPVALLSIGQELADLPLIAWVMAGYLVAGTIATPIYGKLSDIHGRRRMLSIAILIAFAGTLACSLAVSMPMLVGARVVQGLGSGAVFALAQAAVADFVSGPERGRFQAYFSGVFATSALVAPLLGGFLTEHLSWRAIFVLNLPIALLSLWLVRKVLPERAARAASDARIDWLGAALLAAGLATVLIALTRVGQGAGWLGTSTLVLLAIGSVLLALWGWRESDAPQPIVPLTLFRNRVVLSCCLITAFNFFVLIGTTVLLPLFMQTVGAARPDEVAVRLIALTLAVPAGAFTAGRVMMRTRHLGRLTALGCALSGLALIALAWAMPKAGVGLAALMIPLGVGLGLTLPVVMVVAQMEVGPAMTGVVTATVSFFRSLGGVVGIAVLTSVVLAAAKGGAITAADPAALREAFGFAFAMAGCVSLLGAALAIRLPSLMPKGR